MKKQYRLTCDTVLYPKGTIATYTTRSDDMYGISAPDGTDYSTPCMYSWQIEGNSLWEEIIEEVKAPSPQFPDSWEDLGEIEGWYISSNSLIYHTDVSRAIVGKDTFATMNQAKSALAMAQLSQLLKRVNGDWKVKATDFYATIYCNNENKPTPDAHVCTTDGIVMEFLSFPTTRIRDTFLEKYRGLVEEYFLLYKQE